MSRKLTYALIAGLAFTVSGFATNPAHALLFNWSFTSGVGFDDEGETISGTIDGLVEGDNVFPGLTTLTIAVVNTPTGQLEVGGWFFISVEGGSVGFTVTGGQVTFASVRYGTSTGDNLFFGTDPQGNVGVGTASPQLSVGLAGPPIWVNNNGSTVFMPFVDPAPPVVDPDPPTDVPEPATLALFGLGLAGLGYMRRRRAI